MSDPKDAPPSYFNPYDQVNHQPHQDRLLFSNPQEQYQNDYQYATYQPPSHPHQSVCDQSNQNSPQQPYIEQPNQQQQPQQSPNSPIQVLQTQVIPGGLVEQTISLHLPSSQTANAQLYPESANLYNNMVAQFGPNNVKPIPDFIREDKARKQWLKRNENAILYFIYRKEHYKEKIQKMYDVSLCFACCTYEKVNKHDRYNTCEVCIIETFTYCCTMWPTLLSVRKQLNSDINNSFFVPRPNQPDHINISKTGLFCPLCTGGIAIRQDFISRLQQSGINNIDESWSSSCLKLLCLQPCVAIQIANIASYAYQKRYGVARPTDVVLTETASISPDYLNYIQQLPQINQHPYRRAQKELVQQNGTVQITYEREQPLLAGQAVNQLFEEWYKPDRAIKLHNQYWNGIHEIKMEEFNK